MWLGSVDLNETYLSAITFAELRRGVERLPEGRKRRELESWLREDVVVEYSERIFPVDKQSLILLVKSRLRPRKLV